MCYVKLPNCVGVILLDAVFASIDNIHKGCMYPVDTADLLKTNLKHVFDV